MDDGTGVDRRRRLSDARSVRSREALGAALLRLVRDRPFERISIRDITTEAGVSYPVFFRQFDGTNALLESIAAEEVQRLLAKGMAAYGSNGAGGGADGGAASSLALCRHVQDNRDLWTALLTAGAAGAMRSEFVRAAQAFGRTHRRRNPGLPLDLAASLVAAGIFETLAWWLAQDRDYPVARISAILDALVLTPAATPIDLPD